MRESESVTACMPRFESESRLSIYSTEKLKTQSKFSVGFYLRVPLDLPWKVPSGRSFAATEIC